MKKFAVTRKIDPDNINLAIVDNPEVISNEAMEISRYSTAYEENLVPIFSEYIETTAKLYQEAQTEDEVSITKLDLTLLSDDFMITDEIIYDNDNLRVVPLWFEYGFRNYYYNKTRATRVVKRYLDDVYVTNILPDDTKEIILEDGTLTVTPSGLDPLPASTYKLDTNNNRILITNPVSRNLINRKNEQGDIIEKRELTIRFTTIIPDVRVEQYDGTPVDPNFYRLIVQSYTLDEESVFKDIYDCKILLSDIVLGQMIRVYYATYDTVQNIVVEGESVKTVKDKLTDEIVNPLPLYEKVDVATDGSNIVSIIRENNKAFAVHEGNVYSAVSIWEPIFLRYENLTSEKITVLEPQGRKIPYPWYLEILPGHFERDGYTYEVIEKTSYTYQGRMRISKILEDAERIGSTLIKLQNKNIYVTYDRDGDITNMKFYIDGIRRFGFIEDVDTQNGVLLLKKEVSALSVVSVEYYYFTPYVPYRYININPSRRFLDNHDIIQYYMLMYMLPKEELKTEMRRSIFHTLVYKNPSMYQDIKEYEISVEKAEQYVTGLDTAGKSNIYNLIPEYIKPGSGNILHPILLASVNVNATKTEEAAEILDIRNRGGGIIDNMSIQRVLWDQIKSYIDIARWDGHIMNINNVIVIEIPQSAIDRIAHLMSLFDTNTVRKERTQSGVSTTLARAYVENAIKKYTPATKYIHVRIVNDTSS